MIFRYYRCAASRGCVHTGVKYFQWTLVSGCLYKYWYYEDLLELIVPDVCVCVSQVLFPHDCSCLLGLIPVLLIHNESPDSRRRLRHKVTPAHAHCAQTTGGVLQQTHPAPSGGGASQGTADTHSSIQADWAFSEVYIHIMLIAGVFVFRPESVMSFWLWATCLIYWSERWELRRKGYLMNIRVYDSRSHVENIKVTQFHLWFWQLGIKISLSHEKEPLGTGRWTSSHRCTAQSSADVTLWICVCAFSWSSGFGSRAADRQRGAFLRSQQRRHLWFPLRGHAEVPPTAWQRGHDCCKESISFANLKCCVKHGARSYTRRN